MSEHDLSDRSVEVYCVTDYGAKPDSGEDAVPAIRRTIEAASNSNGATMIKFTQGQYDLYPQYAVKEKYYVSNTVSELEHSDPTKTIGLLLKGMKQVTVEGNGSLLMLHGKMTPIIIDHCNQVEICNLKMDFKRPTISEMRIDAVGDDYWDVTVHPHSQYALTDGVLHWIGEGWTYKDGPTQVFHEESNITRRTSNPIALASRVEELAYGQLRLWFSSTPPPAATGYVYQMRDGIRDQIGALMIASKNIKWRNVGMHYMHGLGLVGQFSENLTFEKMRLMPSADSGRTAAAFADFLHLSGIRGKITVNDCIFTGAHDDAINVHGTHLQIMSVEGTDRLRVRFMHGQSYGFPAFFPEDTIDFIRRDTLVPYATRTVKEVTPISLREIELTLTESVPHSIETADVIENASWTPEVEIRGNYFSRIPTRGVLITTRQKVTIEDNVFERMQMSGILISDDANGWFESGMVRDVTIRRNRFIQCGSNTDPVIWVHPENTEVSQSNPVHRNITIKDNSFELAGNVVLCAKSTKNLKFIGNHIVNSTSDQVNDSLPVIHLHACSQVQIAGNFLDGVADCNLDIQLLDMSVADVLFDQ